MSVASFIGSLLLNGTAAAAAAVLGSSSNGRFNIMVMSGNGTENEGVAAGSDGSILECPALSAVGTGVSSNAPSAPLPSLRGVLLPALILTPIAIISLAYLIRKTMRIRLPNPAQKFLSHLAWTELCLQLVWTVNVVVLFALCDFPLRGACIFLGALLSVCSGHEILLLVGFTFAAGLGVFSSNENVRRSVRGAWRWRIFFTAILLPIVWVVSGVGAGVMGPSFYWCEVAPSAGLGLDYSLAMTVILASANLIVLGISIAVWRGGGFTVRDLVTKADSSANPWQPRVVERLITLAAPLAVRWLCILVLSVAFSRLDVPHPSAYGFIAACFSSGGIMLLISEFFNERTSRAGYTTLK